MHEGRVNYNLFLDESWSAGYLRLCAIAISKANSRKQLSVFRAQSRSKRLWAIKEFLRTSEGRAIICDTRLDDWYKQRAIEASLDIKRMSRTDLIWSTAMAYAVEGAMIAVERTGKLLSQVDIFHDPVSLTEQHRDKLYELLRRNLVDMFRAHLKRAQGLRHVQIGRIETVTKDGPDHFLRRGVSLADQVLRGTRPEQRFPVGSPILRMDITGYMDETAKNWGRPGPIRRTAVVTSIPILDRRRIR